MTTESQSPSKLSTRSWGLVVIAWILVGVPLLWGIFVTLKKAILLFK